MKVDARMCKLRTDITAAVKPAVYSSFTPTTKEAIDEILRLDYYVYARIEGVSFSLVLLSHR